MFLFLMYLVYDNGSLLSLTCFAWTLTSESVSDVEPRTKRVKYL